MSTIPNDTGRRRGGRRTRDIIWDAIVDLNNQEQVITREVLREHTGLPLTTIDEHVKKFVDDEEILRRVRSGVFQPVNRPPPARAVSATYLPDGMVKVEVGDALLELWPREARLLGMALNGHSQQYSLIQSGHEVGTVNAELAAQMKRLQETVRQILGNNDIPPSQASKIGAEFELLTGRKP